MKQIDAALEVDRPRVLLEKGVGQQRLDAYSAPSAEVAPGAIWNGHCRQTVLADGTEGYLTRNLCKAALGRRGNALGLERAG